MRAHVHESWDFKGKNYLATDLLGVFGLTEPEVTTAGFGESWENSAAFPAKGQQDYRVKKDACWVFNQTYRVKFQLKWLPHVSYF